MRLWFIQYLFRWCFIFTREILVLRNHIDMRLYIFFAGITEW